MTAERHERTDDPTRPNRPTPPDHPTRPGRTDYHIKIDRERYVVTERELTGEQLRQLPDPPIPEDRDLFLIVPGHPDDKIEDDQKVEIRDGLRFFTAPGTINPGANQPE